MAAHTETVGNPLGQGHLKTGIEPGIVLEFWVLLCLVPTLPLLWHASFLKSVT